MTNLPVIGVPPKSSKVARAEAASIAFECGGIKLPKHAPLATFEGEWKKLGKTPRVHDDNVSVMVQRRSRRFIATHGDTDSVDLTADPSTLSPSAFALGWRELGRHPRRSEGGK